MSDKKIIPGFSNYSIASNGCVYNSDTDNKLSPITKDTGYLYVTLYRDGKGHRRQLHQLVANAFLPNPDKLPLINHRDGNKINNRVSNLKWDTHSGNTSHSFKNKLQEPAKGEDNGKAKLSDGDIRQIRKSKQTGKKLANLYSVSIGMISLIRNKKNWTHVR